ncbi:hypothetical protein DPMN_114964 [Dreissena polymorpha]|uniref:Uncharacterized protein n=1 Tax=Dreissena polymorpha TaxID=45954 RepID=A0A9D4QS84_DREPO|nr:hypothetical protein DPMN_114964 [Dreissena polymorpha]
MWNVVNKYALVTTREDNAELSNVTVENLLTSEADIDIGENESTSEEFDEEFDIINSIDELQTENIQLPEDLD